MKVAAYIVFKAYVIIPSYSGVIMSILIVVFICNGFCV